MTTPSSAHVARRRTTAVRDDRDSAPHVPRSVVVDDRFDWADDRPPSVSWPDTTIYELHVRGFTRRHPGVPRELQGTYAGLAHPEVIGHLTALGVTAVELLPVHHFVTESQLARSGLTNYWGYNSLGFFAPHAAYAASGSRGQQVAEFKHDGQGAARCRARGHPRRRLQPHCRGRRAGSDVVLPRASATRRTTSSPNDRRRYADYTGTGNTLDLSHPHVLQLVMDSLRYWVHGDARRRLPLRPRLRAGAGRCTTSTC